MAEIEHLSIPTTSPIPALLPLPKDLVLFGRVDQLGSGKTKTISVGEAVQSEFD
jgi:glycyl-tRNA synthetase